MTFRSDSDFPEYRKLSKDILSYFAEDSVRKRFFLLRGESDFPSGFFSFFRQHDLWEELSYETEDRRVPDLIGVSGMRSCSDIDMFFLSSPLSDLLLVHIGERCLKKILFPAFEAYGYRLYSELDNMALFFRLRDFTVSVSDIYSAGSPAVLGMFPNTKWEKSGALHEYPCEVIGVRARDLLCANRFDISMKVHYARLWKTKLAKNWREYVFYEQALRITGPSKEIREHDGSGKNGLDQFLENFHSLLEQENVSEYPVLPVDRNLIAMDGAHRIAAGILHRKEMRVVRVDYDTYMPSTYDYYAGTAHGHKPCDPDILDEGVIEYCRVKDSVAVALIFPSVDDHDYAVQKLSKIGNVVCRKSLFLAPSAGGVLLRQVYLGEPWLDWAEHQSGFDHKKKSCFPCAGRVTVLVLDLDGSSVTRLRLIKEEIRAYYSCGKHSIHITDSHDETLRVVKALFNRNSVDILQTSNGKYIESFHRQLFSFQKWLFENNIDCETVCLGGSSVLSVLGLRMCRDLDFLYAGDVSSLPDFPKGVGCHNKLSSLYGYPVDEIIADPRLHFWYMGIKFCSPALVENMKYKRGDKKDFYDIQLIHSLKPAFLVRYSSRVLALFVRQWLKIRIVLGRGKRKILSILESMGKR